MARLVISDSQEIPSGSTLEADICIIGAGPAGIALAREFREDSLQVCVLESGGSDLDPSLESLYSGEIGGLPYARLETTRGWGFGGTSQLWDFEIGSGGPGWQCRPLDEWDFLVRDWIPYSGWPFDLESLVPYYRRAQEVCGLGPFQYEVGYSRGDGETAWQAFRPVVFQYGPSRLFWDTYRAEIGVAQNVHVYLGAVTTGFEASRTGDRVIRVRGRRSGGEAFYVAARVFVMAAGGIENARLLLLSDDVRPGGLGNEHDLVGRYFMEHPHVRTGIFLPSESGDSRIPDQTIRSIGNAPVATWLAPTAETLALERLPSFGLKLVPLRSTARTRYLAMRRPLSAGGRSLKGFITALQRGQLPERPLADLAGILGDLGGVGAAVSTRLRWRMNETIRSLRAGLGRPERDHQVQGVDVMVEQIPNPDSRVMLSDRVDGLGSRQVRLDWKVRSEDRRALVRIQEILDEEMRRLGMGRTYRGSDADRYSRVLGLAPLDRGLGGGHHHMGTTRMHTDPRRGVVDPTCRVHSLSNLFVAGSSVFPTGGFANPTLTVVALALRLADHLKERMGVKGPERFYRPS